MMYQTKRFLSIVVRFIDILSLMSFQKTTVYQFNIVFRMNQYAFNFAAAKSWDTQVKVIERFTNFLWSNEFTKSLIFYFLPNDKNVQYLKLH